MILTDDAHDPDAPERRAALKAWLATLRGPAKKKPDYSAHMAALAVAQTQQLNAQVSQFIYPNQTRDAGDLRALGNPFGQLWP